MDAPPTTARPASRPGLVLLVVAAAQAMSVAASSVVGVALPSLAADLGATSTQQQWVVDAYVVVFASLLVAGGVLGDRKGRRGAFLIGVGLFGAGSLACALAPGTGALIAGRVLQGLGSPILLPASLAIVTTVYTDPRERARAIGLWSTGSGIGLSLGPVLGGILVDTLSWRWVFGINVPMCALLALAAWRLVPRIPATPSPGRFDTGGAVLVTAGVAALAFAIIEGRDHGWGSVLILGAFATSALALTAFVAWERSRAHPMVDVALFRHAPFVAANIAGAAVFFALLGAVVYFAAFFQQVQGREAIEAGLCILPMGLGVIVAAPLSGRMVGRFGPRTPLLAGLVVATAAMLGLLRLEAATTVAAVWWNFALVGIGAGLCLPSMTGIAVGSVEVARAGMAAAIHNSSRYVGQTLGVAVLGTLIFVDPGDFVGGLHHALLVAAGVLAVAAVAVLALVPRSRPDTL